MFKTLLKDAAHLVNNPIGKLDKDMNRGVKEDGTQMQKAQGIINTTKCWWESRDLATRTRVGGRRKQSSVLCGGSGWPLSILHLWGSNLGHWHTTQAPSPICKPSELPPSCSYAIPVALCMCGKHKGQRGRETRITGLQSGLILKPLPGFGFPIRGILKDSGVCLKLLTITWKSTI